MAWLRAVCLLLISALYATSILIPTAAIAENNLIQSANGSQFNGLLKKCRQLDEDPSMTVCGKFWWPDEVRDCAASDRVKAILTFGVSMMVASYASLLCVFVLQCLLSRSGDDEEKTRRILNRGPKAVFGLLVISVVADVITCFLLAVNVEDIGIYPDARLGWGSYILMAGSGTAVVCLLLFTALLCYFFPPHRTGADRAGYTSFTNPASEQTGGPDTAGYPPAQDSVMTTGPPYLQDINNRQNDGQAAGVREKNDNLGRLGQLYDYLLNYKNYVPIDKTIPIPSGRWTRH